MTTENTTETPGIEVLEHNSSTISKTKYITTERELFVEFKGGTTYIYTDVDEETYNDFKDAESQGSFFAKNIRTSFEFTKLED